MARTMRHEKPKNFGLTLRRLLAYLKRHTPMLLLISLLVLISAGANVFGTYLLKPVVNRYILPGDIGGLIRMLAFMGAIYLAGAAATFGYSQLMVKTAQRIIRELRQDLFGTVQKLPLSYFDSKTHGELMSRFTNDIDTIAESLNNSFTALVQNTVMIAGTLTVLLVLNWKLGLIVIATFGGMALFLRYSSKKSHAHFSEQQAYLGSLNGFIEESVEGQKVVKVFNHEEKNLEEFTARNEKLRGAATQALTYSGLIIPVVVSLSYFNYALCACIGAFFAIAGAIDLGSLASYLVYVRQAAMPLNPSAMPRIERTVSALRKLNTGYLAECRILPGEMRWHDATGTERHTDLVLQHLPAGREFAEALLAEDKATLLAALDTLQAALGELEFTHNNLKETNLRWHRGRFVPIRYYDARIGMAEPGTGDREAFAALRHRIAEAPAPRQTANDVTAPYNPLRSLTGHRWTSHVFEGLVCVEDDNGFGFVDTDNNPVIPAQFVWAGDFREGRAEVQTQTGMGLIDRRGCYVIPPEYEIVDYDPAASVVHVRNNGHWALFDYLGRRLTEFRTEVPEPCGPEICR